MCNRSFLTFLLLLCVLSQAPSGPVLAQSRPTTQPGWVDPYREATSRLLGEALSSRNAWERLAELGDTFGHRLSGSQAQMLYALAGEMNRRQELLRPQAT